MLSIGKPSVGYWVLNISIKPHIYIYIHMGTRTFDEKKGKIKELKSSHNAKPYILILEST